MYKIIFIDDSIYEGGQDLNKTLWKEIPNKLIKQINYVLNEKYVCLKEYEAYNHLVEKININRKNSISRVILMGKKDNNVKCVIFDFIKNIFFEEDKEWLKEYNNKPTKGWKSGVNYDT